MLQFLILSTTICLVFGDRFHPTRNTAVHYNFARPYDYGYPLHGYKLKYGHHISYEALGYGHSHKYSDVHHYDDGHHYHGHSQEKGACPLDFPYVYDRGNNCCQYSQDCYGNPLEETSSCCQYYRKCSASICRSLSDLEPGELVRQGVSTLADHPSDEIVLDDQGGEENLTDLINDELGSFEDMNKVIEEAAAEDGNIKKMIEEFNIGQQSSGSQNSNNSLLISDNNQELNKISNISLSLSSESKNDQISTNTSEVNQLDIKDFDKIENIIIDLKSNPLIDLDPRDSPDSSSMYGSNPLGGFDSEDSPDSTSNVLKDMTLPKYEAIDNAFVNLRSNPLIDLDPRDMPDSTSHVQNNSKDSPHSTSNALKDMTLPKYEAVDAFVDLRSNPLKDLDTRDMPDSTSNVLKDMTLPKYEAVADDFVDLRSNPIIYLDSRDMPHSTSHVQNESKESPHSTSDALKDMTSTKYEAVDAFVDLRSNPLKDLDPRDMPDSNSHVQKGRTLAKLENCWFDLVSNPLGGFDSVRSNPLKDLDPRDSPDSTSHLQKGRTLAKLENGWFGLVSNPLGGFDSEDSPDSTSNVLKDMKSPKYEAVDALVDLRSNPLKDLDPRERPHATSHLQKVRTLPKNETPEDLLIELKSNPIADLDSRDSPNSTSQKEIKSNKYEAPGNPIVDHRSNPLVGPDSKSSSDSTSHVQKGRTLSKNEATKRTAHPQIVEPLNLSDDLEAFLEVDNVTNLTRQDIVKRLWKFIKQKKLQELKQEKYFVPHKEVESILRKRKNRNFGLGYGPGQTNIGRAYGHDLVGHFDHRVGPLGPFGFYANFYSDRK